MKINKIKTVLLSMLFLIMSLIVIIIFGIAKSEPTENTNLAPDIVQLADGSWLSLSHFYQMGYLQGSFETAQYISEQDVLKDGVKIKIDLDTIFNNFNTSSKIFFDEYKKSNDAVEELLKNK